MRVARPRRRRGPCLARVGISGPTPHVFADVSAPPFRLGLLPRQRSRHVPVIPKHGLELSRRLMERRIRRRVGKTPTRDLPWLVNGRPPAMKRSIQQRALDIVLRHLSMITGLSTGRGPMPTANMKALVRAGSRNPDQSSETSDSRTTQKSR
jgi:hypothetical protein